MSGKLIVIEGLDGSGKATQSGLLADGLIAEGARVRRVSFPNYESPSSALVKMYLGGAFGSDPDAVNAYAASSFYAVDRYAGYKADWGGFYRDGGIVIADRYTTANAVHQCCKLPESQWDEFLDWLFRFEYEQLGIPAPAMVIYLRMDVDASQALMMNRYHGDAGKKDIHESNLDYLRRAQRAAEYCAARFGWTVIPCFDGGRLRSVEEIQADVARAAQRAIQEK